MMGCGRVVESCGMYSTSMNNIHKMQVKKYRRVKRKEMLKARKDLCKIWHACVTYFLRNMKHVPCVFL